MLVDYIYSNLSTQTWSWIQWKRRYEELRQRQEGNRTVSKDNVPQETGGVPALTALHSRLRRKTDLENRCVHGWVWSQLCNYNKFICSAYLHFCHALCFTSPQSMGRKHRGWLDQTISSPYSTKKQLQHVKCCYHWVGWLASGKNIQKLSFSLVCHQYVVLNPSVTVSLSSSSSQSSLSLRVSAVLAFPLTRRCDLAEGRLKATVTAVLTSLKWGRTSCGL